ncbi:MAG: hypothetical protein FWH53_01550 [Leptospirales bacterium]|nr:hypothetical protein [Leptospirales bacterium]
MKTKIAMLIGIFGLFMTALTSCYNSDREKEATLIINPGATRIQAVLETWPPSNADLTKLEYEVKISGPSEITEKVKGGSGPIILSARPGYYVITVTAYSDGELYASGTTSATVKAGQNNVPITMHRDGIYEIRVAVLPDEKYIQKGDNFTFDAKSFYGPSSIEVSDKYTWSVSGNKSPQTNIDESTGKLFVDSSESADDLTVTAESKTYSPKSGDANVILINPNITLVHAKEPTIIGQPQDATYTINGAAIALTVTASVDDGGTLSYQWYSNSTNSTSGGTPLGAANGAQTKSYTPGTSEEGTIYYFVVITNTNNSVNGDKIVFTVSDTAAVAVNSFVNAAPPKITGQPISANYPQDAPAANLTITAESTDGGALSYQWYSNSSNSNSGGTEIPGANIENYTPSTGIVGTTYYYVVVTNTITDDGKGGQKTSTTASEAITITVVDKINAQKPIIITQPKQSETYPIGGKPTLTVVVEDPPSDNGTLSYQWYSSPTNSNSGGTEISGTNSKNYTPSTGSAGTAYYYVVVTNTISDNGDGGVKTATTVSETATIIVQTPLTGTVSILARGMYVNADPLEANTTLLGVTSEPFTYQWKRGETNIGSNSQFYTIVYDDRNKDITVTVSVDGYYGSVTSAPVTIEDLIRIYNLDQLAAIGISAPIDGNYILMANLDFGSLSEWDPLCGTGSNSFSGTFDGNGKTIKLGNGKVGMKASAYSNVGLFTRISGGTVKNLKLEGVINVNASNSIYAGAVVADMGVSAIIKNVVSEVEIIVTASGSGTVVAYVGGIAGYCSDIASPPTAKIINCYSTGNITASGSTISYAGGIMGNNRASVEYCWAEGEMYATSGSRYAGGIVASNTGNVSNCVALNAIVSVNNNTDTHLGRVCGDIISGATAGNNYANDAMQYSTNSGGLPLVTFTSADDPDDRDGGDVSVSSFATLLWWTDSSGPNWAYIQTSKGSAEDAKETNPWWWKSGGNRPILWFDN